MGSLTILNQNGQLEIRENAEERFLAGLEYRSRVISTCSSLVAELEASSAFDDQKKEALIVHLRRINESADRLNIACDSIYDELAHYRTVVASGSLDIQAAFPEIKDWVKSQYNLLYALNQIGTWIFKEQNEERLKTQRKTPARVSHTGANDRLKQIKALNQRILLLEILLKKTRPESVPPILVVDPTSHCNFRCRHCAQSNHQDHRHTYLSQDTIEKLRPILYGVEQAKLFGTGEATLSPFLPELIELTHAYGCQTEVQTNGSTLGKRALNFELIDQLGISFDGGCARTFEALRVGANFNQLVERIGKFTAQHPQSSVYFAVTVSRINIDELLEITQWAARLGVKRVFLNKIIPYMDKLLPIALRRSDKEIFEVNLKRAVEFGAQNNVQVINCISVDHELDDQQELDKLKLIEYLEGMHVIGNHRLPSANELIKRFGEFQFEAYPKVLSERFIDRNSNANEPRPEYPIKTVEMLEQYQHQLSEELRQTKPEEIAIPYCTSPWVKCFVEAHSGIRPCDPWATDVSSFNTANTFSEAWQSPDLVNLRKATVGEAPPPKKCQSCTFAERHLYVDELIALLKEHGIDTTRVQFPEKFNSLDALREGKTRDAAWKTLHQNASLKQYAEGLRRFAEIFKDAAVKEQSTLRCYRFRDFEDASDFLPIEHLRTLKKEHRRNCLQGREEQYLKEVVNDKCLRITSPYSGELIASTKSLIWHEVVLYIFCEANHIFYYIRSNSDYGRFLYLPELETIFHQSIQFKTNKSLEELVRDVKKYLLENGEFLFEYLTNEAPPKTFLYFVQHRPAHYLSERIYSLYYLNLVPGQLDKVDGYIHYPLVTYLDPRKFFPQIADKQFLRLDNSEKDEYYRVNGFAHLATDFNLKEIEESDFGSFLLSSALSAVDENELTQHVVNVSKRVGGKFNSIEQLLNDAFPVLWLGISAESRAWINQQQGLRLIIEELAQRYPKLALIFDGVTGAENNVLHHKSLYDREHRLFQEISDGVSALDLTTIKLLGVNSRQKLYFANFADFCVTQWGTLSVIPAKLSGIPSFLHTNKADLKQIDSFTRKGLIDYHALHDRVMIVRPEEMQDVPEFNDVDLAHLEGELYHSYSIPLEVIKEKLESFILPILRRSERACE